MKTAGVRELKNRLSEYLRLVRSGESVLVTDRGELVAELALPTDRAVDKSVPPGLAALARQGHVCLATRPDAAEYRLLPLPRDTPAGLAARLLDQERGER